MRGEPAYTFIVNKTSKTFSANGGAKRLQFGPRTLSDEFDPAIRKIADDAGDFEAGGNGFDGVTKANSLNAARVEKMQAAAGWSRRDG